MTSLLLREPNLPACHCYIHINEEKKKKKKSSINFVGTPVINSSLNESMGTELNKVYF